MSKSIEYVPVKNLNAKSAGIDPKTARKLNGGEFVRMIRIYGLVTGIKNFEDRKSGDVKTKLLGDFRAESPDGTKGWSADVLFVFRALEDKLTSTFKAGGEKPLEFAYDIVASPDEKSVTGYVYGAKPLIQTASSDRLNAIAEALAKRDEQAQTQEAPEEKKNAEPVGKDAEPVGKGKGKSR